MSRRLVNGRKLRAWLRTHEGKAQYTPDNAEWVPLYWAWVDRQTPTKRKQGKLPAHTIVPLKQESETPKTMMTALTALSDAAEGVNVEGRWYLQGENGRRSSGPYRDLVACHLAAKEGETPKFTQASRGVMKA